jgi:hypothetical protein
MPDIYGRGWIGPKSRIEKDVELVRQDYNRRIGENIIGGPGGAAGYLIGGDKGSYVGAAFDQVALSFGGLPGKGFSTRPVAEPTPKFIPYTESSGSPRPVDYKNTLRLGAFSIFETLIN